MPSLSGPDGVEIHWEERGEGPPVLISPHANSHPSVFEPLIAELERDHRVVRYDARGYGSSTRGGPHDMETGADDLAALAEELGGGAVVIGLADACGRTTRAAVREPELFSAVIAPGTAPLNRDLLRSTPDALVSSDSVIEGFFEQLSTDYRGAIRALMTFANQQMSEEEVRERVEAQIDYAPQEAVLERLQAWLTDDTVELGKQLGDRIWMLRSPEIAGPWFPSGDDMYRMLEPLFPEAHQIEIADGIVSRPDLTAAVIREITLGSS